MIQKAATAILLDKTANFEPKPAALESKLLIKRILIQEERIMFMESLKETLNEDYNVSVTENGAVGYRTTGKELLGKRGRK